MLTVRLTDDFLSFLIQQLARQILFYCTFIFILGKSLYCTTNTFTSAEVSTVHGEDYCTTILPQQASTVRGIDNFIEQLFYLSGGGNSSWDR